ncbi:MAG TPA: TRAM domain-containing protein [Gemmatimonadaceae bacterium]|nr:TRAM domain-containing protein [Gemmatimonadaceae bacterium]
MQTATVRVESVAAGGDGVARVDSLVLFLPRTAPGDELTARFEPAKGRRFARGEVAALIHPAADRVTAPCAHYVADRCGGCQLQHLRYDAQVDAKARIIGDALARLAKRPVPLPAVRPSTAEWRYRRKLTLALRRAGRAWIAGLHPYDVPDVVFELRECPITDPRVLEVWREVMDAAPRLPQAPQLRGAVRLDGDGATFLLQGADTWPESLAFFEAVPSLSSLWWQPRHQKRRLMFERGGSHAPGASFVQVNAGVAAEMHRHVIERVLAHRPRVVVDAYAGLGETAVALAREGLSVTAIELDADAARWCAGQLPPGSRAVAARVEDALPDALPADVVILNPPRTGIDPRVAAVLEQSAPPPAAIIYVSCDPATLARDLARMPRFRIQGLVGFDMFPQTAHVETVCELVPERA